MPLHLIPLVRSQRRSLAPCHDNNAAARFDPLKTCLEAAPSASNRLEPGICRTAEEREAFLGKSI